MGQPSYLPALVAKEVVAGVIKLYHDDPDPELKELVGWAVKRQRGLKP